MNKTVHMIIKFGKFEIWRTFLVGVSIHPRRSYSPRLTVLKKYMHTAWEHFVYRKDEKKRKMLLQKNKTKTSSKKTRKINKMWQMKLINFPVLKDNNDYIQQWLRAYSVYKEGNVVYCMFVIFTTFCFCGFRMHFTIYLKLGK